MSVNKSIVFIIIGCGIVTWLPRIIPFIFSKKFTFPKLLNDFLSYIPMCILTALLVQNLLIQSKTGFPDFNIENILASLPTFLVAILTKNLMWTVIIGIISMALLRFIM